MARVAKVTQAEIERAIRAVESAGLKVLRVVARTDGYAIETNTSSNHAAQPAIIPVRPVL